MSRLVSAAMAGATRALVQADLGLAETVIAEDNQIDHSGRRCEARACTMLALQAPVAGDLRVVVSAIKVAEKLERMGDLARHIAELTRMRHPDRVLPAALATPVERMGRLATDAAQRVTDTLTHPTGDRFADQDRADDAIDQLHRAVLDQALAADPPYPTQVGVDVALLARYVERFADQAVTVTKQLDYMVTGQKAT